MNYTLAFEATAEDVQRVLVRSKVKDVSFSHADLLLQTVVNLEEVGRAALGATIGDNDDDTLDNQTVAAEKNIQEQLQKAGVIQNHIKRPTLK
jgi:hypothetical protein